MLHLHEKIKKLENEISALHSELVEAYKKSPEVLERLKELETQVYNGPYFYTWNECGDICQEIECKAFDKVSDNVEYREEALKALVEESVCAYMREGNKSKLYFLIPDIDAIYMSSKGDVYQSNKCIIYKSNETRAEMAQLIEEHMEREGVFPGVYELDCHDNIRIFDTKNAMLEREEN